MTHLFVFLSLQESPLQKKSRSAYANVVGMAKYCNAIPERLENLPDVSFQKEWVNFRIELSFIQDIQVILNLPF